MTDQEPGEARAEQGGPETLPETLPETPPGITRTVSTPTVQYKGAPLEAERGPGLGCFWLQLAVLTAAVVITPLSVVWGWPEGVSAALLFLVVLLLLFTGQTVIFLLRLVAADRRATGRRRPLASATRTVGELEDDDLAGADGESAGGPPGDGSEGPGAPAGEALAGGPPDGRGPVRQ